MRFRVSQFGSKCYGEPLCGWRVVDTQAPRPVSATRQGSSRVLAVFPTKEQAEEVAGLLNAHANDMTSERN